MILNLNDEDAQNIICAKKLTIMEDHNESNYLNKNDLSSQECVEKSV